MVAPIWGQARSGLTILSQWDDGRDDAVSVVAVAFTGTVAAAGRASVVWRLSAGSVARISAGYREGARIGGSLGFR